MGSPWVVKDAVNHDLWLTVALAWRLAWQSGATPGLVAMIAERTNEAAGLPPPSPAFAAMRMLVQAHLRTIGRRKAERYLRELAALVANEESIRLLFPTRPKHERAAQQSAQDEAAAWIRQMLPELTRSLPPD